MWPVGERANPVWRALPAWTAHLLADGAERADIVVGFSECVRSLQERSPNSLAYFPAAIARAREARTRPLLPAAPKADEHQLGPVGQLLREQLGEDVFASWFVGSRLLGIRGDTAMISVPSSLKQQRILANYEAQLIEGFKTAHPQVARIAVTVETMR